MPIPQSEDLAHTGRYPNQECPPYPTPPLSLTSSPSVPLAMRHRHKEDIWDSNCDAPNEEYEEGFEKIALSSSAAGELRDLIRPGRVRYWVAIVRV